VTTGTHPGCGPDETWDPDSLVRHLAAGWKLADPEAFITHFRPVFHPDVTSRQPLSPPRTGISAVEEQFRRIFRLLPGATATIRSWGSAQPNVYVEFELHAPSRRHPLQLHTCDRFTLTHGLVTERAVYFDPTVLLRFIARNPHRWPAALSARWPSAARDRPNPLKREAGT
jgi:hypothetical protein